MSDQNQTEGTTVETEKVDFQNVSKDAVKGLTTNYYFSPEQRENLRALKGSSMWRTYRAVLQSAKEAHFQSMLSDTEPAVISKTMGIIVGLNLAINQLVALIDGFNQQDKKNAADAGRVPGGPKNPAGPFRQ